LLCPIYMNLCHFEEHKTFVDRGLKREATAALRAFIDSITNEADREKWVLEYLKSLAATENLVVRHEIFEDLVFPVLCKGYKDQDVESTVWLGRLSQNLYKCQRLHEQVESKAQFTFYKEALSLDPSKHEVSRLLLVCYIDFFRYSIHEWPAGVLYGMNGASISECAEIRKDLVHAMALDEEGTYRQFLHEYAEKLDQYEQRLGHNHCDDFATSDNPRFTRLWLAGEINTSVTVAD